MSHIIVIGVNHRTADVGLRERFALSSKRVPAALAALQSQEGVKECVVLSTCNRVEIYTVERVADSSSPLAAHRFLSDFFAIPLSEFVSHLYMHKDEHAVRHLFLVTASLDSMVVGEPQILGQVKEAFGLAQREGTTGPVFHRLFNHALHVGKRVRTETEIGRFAVSVPYAALELAKQVFPSLENKRIVVIGRGKMSEVAVRHFQNAGVGELIVVGRCFGHACQFAQKMGDATARPYDQNLTFLDDVDIVLASTQAPHFLIEASAVEALMKRRRGEPLLLIDISVPRVIEEEAGNVNNVLLYNIDHLEGIVKKNYSLRQSHASQALKIIEEELGEFRRWLASRNLVPTIRAFHKYLEALCEEELRRVFGKSNGHSPEQREAIERFAHGLIRKIRHQPVSYLKSINDPYMAAHVREAFEKLFDLKDADD